MATVIPMPDAATPAARILSRFDRRQLAGFIEVAIGLLDLADGDPDLEPDGDERDANGSEEDFMAHRPDGPGCALADRPEPTLAAPEATSGYWGGNLVVGDNEDGEVEPDDPEGRGRHRDRIRRTRCDAFSYDRYRLRGEPL